MVKWIILKIRCWIVQIMMLQEDQEQLGGSQK